MPATELLFVYIYCLVDDATKAGTTRAQRRTMPKPVQRLIARFRNRVEASFKEITDQMELARHGAHCFEGLLTRTAATLAAHTLLLTLLPDHG